MAEAVSAEPESVEIEDDERNGRILELAHEQWHKSGEIEIDDMGPHPDASAISEGDDNGAYVRAWVWVDFAGTDLDKEAECICGHVEEAHDDNMCRDCETLDDAHLHTFETEDDDD